MGDSSIRIDNCSCLPKASGLNGLNNEVRLVGMIGLGVASSNEFPPGRGGFPGLPGGGKSLKVTIIKMMVPTMAVLRMPR